MIKKYFGLGARIIVGAIFVVFGTNGIAMLYFGSPFIPMEAPPEGSPAAQYFAVLAGSYILKTVKIVEVLGGLMLLSGIYMPLGAIILMPIVINIFLFHYTMAPGYGEMAMSITLLAGEGVIFWAYWAYFKSLLHIRKGA